MCLLSHGSGKGKSPAQLLKNIVFIFALHISELGVGSETRLSTEALPPQSRSQIMLQIHVDIVIWF